MPAGRYVGRINSGDKNSFINKPALAKSEILTDWAGFGLIANL